MTGHFKGVCGGAAQQFGGLERLFQLGYAPGMKTAVSIPDEVFENVERLARRMKKSRSELFSHALAEYLARHAPDQVTESMNQVCSEIGSEPDPFVSAASRRLLERSEW
jgi:hypothetical protein